ncbi:MAG: response regulator transcription factor [Planctomycetota bacterium]
MSRLLIVEDEDRLARSITVGLQDEGYVVDRAKDGEEALWFTAPRHHDAIILDLRLPRLGGLEVCRRVRASGARTPILMLTACDRIDDVVIGLDQGADDYLTKPFEFAELLARLRALLRRGLPGASARLTLADLVLDTAAHKVWRNDQEVALSRLEFRVLEFLLLHAGCVQSKARIVAAVWDDEIGPESNVLEVVISNLRRKLDRAASQPLLHTRRGAGYIMSADRR